MVELDFGATPAPPASPLSGNTIASAVVRIGDYEVIPSAAAETEADGVVVWYGSAVARRVAGGEALDAAFDYYKVACATEHEALAFAVQRTSERLLVTFGASPLRPAGVTACGILQTAC